MDYNELVSHGLYNEFCLFVVGFGRVLTARRNSFDPFKKLQFSDSNKEKKMTTKDGFLSTHI